MKGGIVLFFVSLVIFSPFLLAAIQDSLPIQVQTTDASGNIITGTFQFTINISDASNCSSVLYSDVRSLATDNRGIVSYNLNNVNLPFDDQYYFCYYRDGVLKQTLQSGRTPYAFNSKFLGSYDENFFAPLNTTLVGDFNVQGSLLVNGIDTINSSSADTIPLNTIVYYNGTTCPQGFNETAESLLTRKNLAKAWVNFDGNTCGGTCTILDSFNVDNITYVGTGEYIVYWDKDFPNTYYSLSGAQSASNAQDISTGFGTPVSGTKGIDSVRVYTRVNGALANRVEVNVLAFGNQSEFPISCIKTSTVDLTAGWSQDASNIWVTTGNLRTGINTTTPQNTLNVVGDGNFTGNLYSNGQLVGSGSDTNETTRFDSLVAVDCTAGSLVIGIQSNGTVLCAADNGGTTYTHLTNFTDDLGNRGYTNLLNFTNGPGYYNLTDFDINDYLLSSNWNATNISYYLATNPFGFYNSTTLPPGSEPNWEGNYSTFLAHINWGEATNGTLYLSSNPSGFLDWSNAVNGTLALSSSLSSYLLNTGDTAAGNYSFDTNTLHIDSSTDRIGIGTTSPNQKLHVQGNINTTGLYYGNGSQLTDISISDLSCNGCVDSTDLASNSVQTSEITDSAVTSSKISDSSVTSTKIGLSAVGSNQLAADSVTTDKIQDLAVISGKIANLAVSSGKIGDGAVTSTKIANGAVGGTQLATNAVASGNIQGSAVSEAKIADTAVTANKIAAGAVGSTKIANGAVGNSQLATDAVGTGNIIDGAVTSTKIGTNAVGNANLATNAVDTTNIQDGAVTDLKVADSISIDNGRLYAPTGAGSVGIGVASPTNTLNVLGTSNFTSDADVDNMFYFEGYSASSSERDIFTIVDPDDGGNSQDESSILKIIKTGTLGASQDAFSLMELVFNSTGAVEDEHYYVLARNPNDEGQVTWGIALTDSDIWTTGGFYGGATGTDCGGTNNPCFNSPTINFSVSGDSYINTGGNLGIGTVTPQNPLNVIGNVNTTGNLTLGDTITFRLGEIIDNIVDGWISLTGSLDVSGDLNVTGVINSTGLTVLDNVSDTTSAINIKLENTQGGISAGNNEDWHEIGAASEPAFQNSWGNVGGADETAGFRKLPNGMVALKGQITHASGSSADAFTLPVGYRPANTLRFSVYGNNAGPDATTVIYILSNGSVQQSASFNFRTYGLNIQFYAEN